MTMFPSKTGQISKFQESMTAAKSGFSTRKAEKPIDAAMEQEAAVTTVEHKKNSTISVETSDLRENPAPTWIRDFST